MYDTRGDAVTPELLSLWRARHVAFITMILSILVFISSFFAYFVGVVAGVFTFLGGLVTFHRCESGELVSYGVHPCFGGICGCGPLSELHSARLSLMVGAFLCAVSFVIALIFSFDDDSDDWLIAIRIICAVLSFLLCLASLATLGSLQVALGYFGLAAPFFGNGTVDTGPPQTPPRVYAGSPVDSYQRSPPRYGHSAPPTASRAQPTYYEPNDPYADARSPQPVATFVSRSPPRNAGRSPRRSVTFEASPVQPAFSRQPQAQPPHGSSGLRPLSTYDTDTQQQTRGRSGAYGSSGHGSPPVDYRYR